MYNVFIEPSGTQIAKDVTMAIRKHSKDEFHSNANGQRAWLWANRKLQELTETTDEVWASHLRRAYLGNLRSGHVNGENGSLLEAA